MIFITVGTHEQGLDRLLLEVDNLINDRIIKDNVFAQIGYSKYIPKNYKYKEMLGFDEMNEIVKNSEIVITHGGPGSIFQVIQSGKIPIVVPRNPKYKEHVDEHQILFTKRLEKTKKVIGVYDISELGDRIVNYSELTNKCKIDESNKKAFLEKFETIVNRLEKK